MRSRPPTIRVKWRYILVRTLPHWAAPSQKEVYLATIKAVTSLWGDVAAGHAQPAVVFCDGGYAVVRCRRGTEGDIATALTTVTTIADERVALRTVAISGTIHALKRRMRPTRPLRDAREVMIAGRQYMAHHYPRQKVDLVEKGIMHHKSLFFTETDLEER